MKRKELTFLLGPGEWLLSSGWPKSLNPIENAWSWMKKQLSDTSTATNMGDWKREVTELWVLRMRDSQYLRNLVESMPRRLKDVISREGNPTEY